jgi:hypothetical protein
MEIRDGKSVMRRKVDLITYSPQINTDEQGEWEGSARDERKWLSEGSLLQINEGQKVPGEAKKGFRAGFGGFTGVSCRFYARLCA